MEAALCVKTEKMLIVLLCVVVVRLSDGFGQCCDNTMTDTIISIDAFLFVDVRAFVCVVL